jgi:hypothetical protein
VNELRRDLEREPTPKEAMAFAQLLDFLKGPPPLTKSQAFDLIHAAEATGHIFAVVGVTVDDARGLLGEFAYSRP